ncbi:hypothetical protein Trydic_g13272 [Trypoxylus dichotomus]
MLTIKEGVVNELINKLPIELHLPGYQYCGPGTKLKKRLARGDPDINQLDAACKAHDIAYSENKDLEQRHKADKVLEEKAWSRVKSSDASIGEEAAAWAVTNIMKAKRKLGMGLKTKAFSKTVFVKAKDALKRHKVVDVKDGVNVALNATRATVKEAGGRKYIRTPRILPILKSGGVLPLIPMFAGLSALGGLAGGVANVARAVNATKNAQQELEETRRHTRTLEAIALGKNGNGLYIKPYRKGMGLISLHTYNTIPNVTEQNNKFCYHNKVMKLPVGSYEASDIEEYLKSIIPKDSISLRPNNNALKVEIDSKYAINVKRENTLGRLLGFSKRILEPNRKHESDLPVQILKVVTIRIEYNIITSS